MRLVIFFICLFNCGLWMTAETRVALQKAGTLASLLSQVQQDTITSLVIEGPINSADIRLLRRMAGYREHEGDKAGKLRTLDLRNARITSDKEPYLVLDAVEEGLTVEGHHRVMNLSGSYDVKYPVLKEKSDVLGTHLHKVNDFYRPRYIIGGGLNRHQHSILSTSPNGDVRLQIGEDSAKKIEKTLRKYNMKKLKGLRLKLENKRYLLYCYPKKDEFVMNMFYNCPSLAALSIPSNAEVSQAVVVLRDDIRYYQFGKKETRATFVHGDYE